VILHPVLARVARDLGGRRGVAEARRLGRAALELSARLAHRPPILGDAFPRDAGRAPLPVRGAGTTWHWSTTNTAGLAAAVVAPVRVGIDAEWLDRPRIHAPLEYFDPKERALLGLDERRGVLALWSAKEAVLKARGVGMAGMGRVRVLTVDSRTAGDRRRLVASLDGELASVELLWVGPHVLALACPIDDFEVEPAVLEGAPA